MMRKSRNGGRLQLQLGLLLVACLATCPTARGVGKTPIDKAPIDQAREILDAGPTRGGLIVHLGCGTGELTAALRAGESYLVHGLDADADNVAKAREFLQQRKLYGPVTVEQWTESSLPYADDVVNLLVAGHLGNVPMEEVMRVLRPLGTACIKIDGQWTTVRKPWPEAIGQWTHYLHDASNNAVSRDKRVGPPSRLRWVCGPRWARSHETTSSLCAMVTGGGRLFYIFDEGQTGITAASTPPQWTLIARDAFNGVLLWKRPLTGWGLGLWKAKNLRGTPGTIPRLLVAQDGRVFAMLGRDEGLSALDAATGEILTTYKATEGTEEIRCIDGMLLLRKRPGTIIAIDVDLGRRLWETAGRIQPFTLAARGEKVFFQDGPSLVCLQRDTGKPLWKAACQARVSLLVVHQKSLFLLAGPKLLSFSAETGEKRWTVNARVARRELFVAGGQLWHWENERPVGRDLATGAVKTRPDVDDVFTPGHHLRCYPAKCTEDYLITPNRGIEFVGFKGQPNYQSDWVRGPCTYGIMPGNGLIYAGPDPCFCYPGVKLTGFNALASASPTPIAAESAARNPRLTKGPAFGTQPVPLSAFRSPLSALRSPLSADWPTFRHDARRSGATACEITPEISQKWQVPLSGNLTPPVVAQGRVYVAAKDEHTLYVFGITDGNKLWQFTAAGRIDSPPTVEGGLVLFGSADGYVYCLRADDGQLAWRFRAAPIDRRIVAMGRLESAWRVHGSILLTGGVAYCTAGRSSYLDGGIRLFGLDPATGKVLHEARLDTWARTREDAKGKPFVPGYQMEGATSDVLVSQDDFIYLGQTKFDRRLIEQEVPYILAEPGKKPAAMDLAGEPYTVPDEDPKADYETHQRQWLERTQRSLLARLRAEYGSYSLGDRRLGLHVFSTAGFLDDSWFNRTYWMYSSTWPGYYLAHRAAKTGQLLVVGPERTFAVQGFPSRNLQSPLFTPGTTGYLLLADANDNEPALDYRTRGTTKGWGFTRNAPPVWYAWVPVRVRGMVLAGEHLLVAGPPDVVDPDDPMAALEGRKGGVLQMHAAADGKTLARYQLPAPCVFDGLIAAAGRVLVCTTDGHVICFGR